MPSPVGHPGRKEQEVGGMDVLLTLRSPRMWLLPGIPVADGKKMENIPKKLPSMPLPFRHQVLDKNVRWKNEA